MATATNNDLRFNAAVSLDMEAAKADPTKPARVSIVAYSGGEMTPPGFAGPVVIDLGGVTITGRVPLLVDHVNALSGAVGAGVASIAGNQLLVEGQLSRSSASAKQIIDLAAEGFPWQASVGMDNLTKEVIRAGQTVVVNGQKLTASQRGLTVVRGGTLREVSFTPAGADANTSVAISASKGKQSMSTELTNEATDLQADRLRAASVPTWLADAPDLIAKGIAEGWDKQRCELENLKAFRAKSELEQLRGERAKAPAIHHGVSAPEADVLCAGLCLNAGMAESFVGEHFDQRTMNAAVSREGRNTTFSTVLRAVARAAGNPLPEGKLTAADVRTAFEANLQLRASGFSTLSIPGVLGSAATKSMLSGYSAINAIAPLLCAKRNLADFKTWTHYRLTESGLIEKLGPTSELKHTTVNEASFTNQLDTYGRMISFTRRDIINDDLGALSDVPRMLGRMAALKVEDAFFTMLLSNPSTFFGTGNNNYISGSGTTLQISQLDALSRKFKDQTDPDGKPVLLVPKYLLVPTALDATARQLISSLELMGSTTADTLKPSGNPFANTLVPLSSPYLGNSSYTGYSATAWYLVAEPTDIAAFGLGYLNGVTTPTIESAEASFNTLGVEMRVYFDFGVGCEDYRAAAMSKGAA